jgi:hypothetical protein
MSSSAYKYLSDDGNVYQVVLDDAFAGPLGYVVATGAEPYLPSYISPRYASFQTSTGVLMNAAYVTTPFNHTNPPAVISVSGVTYLLKSSYGEQRGFSLTPSPSIVVCVPAPTSGGGSSGVSSLTAGTGISVSSSTGNVTVSNTGVSSFAPNQSGYIISFTATSILVASHSLGRAPYFTRWWAECTSADNGYSVGDRVEIASNVDYYGSGGNYQGGQSLWSSASQIGCVADAYSDFPTIFNKTTQAAFQASSSKWKIGWAVW